MLERLTIQNYALIESLDIEFPDGLVIVTGETGAGKSVLLGAISLLCASKADSSFIRNAKKNCVVEAEFANNGGGHRILRRVITPALKSRFFVDDEPVSASEMAKVAADFLDIHSQHSNLLLGNTRFQMDVLDGFCSNAKLLASYQAEYSKVLELEKSLAKAEEAISKAEALNSQTESDLKRLEAAHLKEGEIYALEQEQRQLENVEYLAENTASAAMALDGEGASVVQLLKEASKNVEKCLEFAPELDQLADRLESCRIECKDICSDIDKFAAGISASPQRLAQIEERLSTLYALAKRYSCNTDRDLIAYYEGLKESASDLDSLYERKAATEKKLAESLQQRQLLAARLTRSRTEGAAKLQKQLLSSVRGLEMPAAEFVVEVLEASGFGPDGKDVVRFLFSANPKEKMVELQKVASGGELSRIMLCIKSLMAAYRKMPTVFFDEIDVGVSGSVADKMGRQIVKMGDSTQVFAITHLPQVASKGAAHLLVYKEALPDGRSTIRLRFLDKEDRVKEVARLLSGEKTTSAALDNARELLKA